jgi:FAD/FMN-containing dehydrogenase
VSGQGFDGPVHRRGEDGYEQARLDALWNVRIPDAYPEVIVRARSERDAVGAVRLARDQGMQISVRSGGHSWAGNHIRDGGVLVDLSALDEMTVDPDSCSATVQPGVQGTELVARLAEDDLFFPAGHCVGVAVGGYLLQGGFGWNGRVHGPACASVEAIDVVTADGELVHADSEQNPDLLWAARGAGPGFFGLVTRFHLRLYDRPRHIANAFHTYPIELLDDVFTWAAEIGPRVDRRTELMVVVHYDPSGEVEIAVTGPTLVDSEEQAREALSLLETCPVVGRAKTSVPYMPVTMDDLYAGVHFAYPDGHRYVADNIWTHAPAERLIPGIRRIAETLPEAPYSHMLWMNWGESPERPEMAYSCEDETYIAVYGVWTDPAKDAEHVPWAAERMREIEHLSTGIQLADENLGARPARFMSDANLRRLDEIRAARDPDGTFREWMGRPDR